MYLDISSMKEINSLGNLQPNLFSKFTQSRSEGSFKFSFSLSKILLNTFSISSLFISYSSFKYLLPAIYILCLYLYIDVLLQQRFLLLFFFVFDHLLVGNLFLYCVCLLHLVVFC